MEYAGKDAQLWAAIGREEQRQEGTIELIASENIVSKEVAAAQGSVLTNKYAEGYLASATTAVANLLTRWSNSPLITLRNSLALPTLTFNPTPVPKLTWRSTKHY